MPSHILAKGRKSEGKRARVTRKGVEILKEFNLKCKQCSSHTQTHTREYGKCNKMAMKHGQRNEQRMKQRSGSGVGRGYTRRKNGIFGHNHLIQKI